MKRLFQLHSPLPFSYKLISRILVQPCVKYSFLWVDASEMLRDDSHGDYHQLELLRSKECVSPIVDSRLTYRSHLPQHLMSPTFMNQVKEIAQLATPDEAEAKSWFKRCDLLHRCCCGY
jgi:hypothetical protein